MDIIGFIVTIVAVTASGALAPGPLFFVNIAHGTKSGAKGGLAFSIGHTIIEFSLVMLLAMLLAFGLSTQADEPVIRPAVGIVGGGFLLVFGALQAYQFLISKSNGFAGKHVSSRNPLLLGSIFTGLNPYFIVWWLTAGLGLIMYSLDFASWPGVLLMYVAHVWMDYAWLTATAYLAKRGTSLVDNRVYRILMAICGGILVYFGLQFILSSF